MLGTHAIARDSPARYDNGVDPESSHGKEGKMKNPLDSLGQTVALGFGLTVIVVILIHIIA
jgi:hypothetical protein